MGYHLTSSASLTFCSLDTIDLGKLQKAQFKLVLGKHVITYPRYFMLNIDNLIGMINLDAIDGVVCE